MGYELLVNIVVSVVHVCALLCVCMLQSTKLSKNNNNNNDSQQQCVLFVVLVIVEANPERFNKRYKNKLQYGMVSLSSLRGSNGCSDDDVCVFSVCS